MKKILTANHPAEAQMVVDFLSGEGVAAEVRGEMLFGARGELPISEASPTVWVVDEEQEAHATQLLEAYFKQAEEQANATWTCSCGETHEGQFTSCWNCGAPRPSA